MITTYERFMRKVVKQTHISSPHVTTPCWHWIGSISGSGYGQFWIGDRIIPAHWFLLDAFPPKGNEACHRCDNKRCVRPSHVFIGTRGDNVRDCRDKGRLNPKPGLIAAGLVPYSSRDTANSEQHGRAKLTNVQVRKIRATNFKFGEKAALARKLGVTGTIITRIVKRTSWTYVD